MELKAIRVIPPLENIEETLQKPVQATPEPEKVLVIPYEKRLEKMSTRQLRGEVRKGIRGKLSGYNSVAESVVLDVILQSFERGMTPYVQ